MHNTFQKITKSTNYCSFELSIHQNILENNVPMIVNRTFLEDQISNYVSIFSDTFVFFFFFHFDQINAALLSIRS